MARTMGSGNPNWSRDETILALDLYLSAGSTALSPDDARVKELSEVLRKLPHHASASKAASFRNPAGVAFKIQNLRSVATGQGLKNVSAIDREVWKDYGHKPAEVRQLALAVTTAMALPAAVDDAGDDEEFAEGGALTRLHRSRERSRSIRRKLIRKRVSSGTIRCDLCGSGPRCSHPDFFTDEFEAHHKLPLADAVSRKTRLSDMALLCAGCHRLLHRLMIVRKRLVTFEEARDVFAFSGPDG